MELSSKKLLYPILVIDPRQNDQDLFYQIKEEFKIHLEIVSTQRDAIELSSSNSYSFFIYYANSTSDLSFIFHLKNTLRDPLILVISDYESKEWIKELKRIGVFDIVFNPLDPLILKNIISRILDYSSLKEMQNRAFDEEATKIKTKVGWVNAEVSSESPQANSHTERSIYNLKTSLSQGSGFGAMVSLIDMIKMSAELNGEAYKIDSSLMNLLFENNEYSRKVLEELHYDVDLMNSNFSFKQYKISNFESIFPDLIIKPKEYALKRNIQIIFNLENVSSELGIELSLDIFQIAIEELLINAIKFSKSGTNILISSRVAEMNYFLSIENFVNTSFYSGIPFDLESLVMEPFFRNHPPVEDVFGYEKIGFGLGLTAVDYILNRHRGYFSIHNEGTINNENGNALQKVIAEIYLPILK